MFCKVLIQLSHKSEVQQLREGTNNTKSKLTCLTRHISCNFLSLYLRTDECKHNKYEIWHCKHSNLTKCFLITKQPPLCSNHWLENVPTLEQCSQYKLSMLTERQYFSFPFSSNNWLVFLDLDWSFPVEHTLSGNTICES